MAIHHLSLPTLLAWALLAMPFLIGEASKTAGPYKPRLRQHVASNMPDEEQDSWMPIMIILGGCCGLALCLLFMDQEINQREGQERLPWVPRSEEVPKEQNTIMVVKKYLHKETLKCSPGRQAEHEELSDISKNVWAQVDQELQQLLELVGEIQKKKKIPSSAVGTGNSVLQQKSATNTKEQQSQNVEINKSGAQSKSRGPYVG